jgi:hypothetical protein
MRADAIETFIICVRAFSGYHWPIVSFSSMGQIRMRDILYQKDSINLNRTAPTPWELSDGQWTRGCVIFMDWADRLNS